MHRFTIFVKTKEFGLRIPTKSNWSDTEIKFLIENYPTKRCEWCAEQLVRSKRSVYTKAERLGLKVAWTYRYINEDGYVEAVLPNSQKILEHRFNLEIHLGRKLATEEKVHHLDMNKTNNEIDNLIILNNADHSYLHYLIDARNFNVLEDFVLRIPNDDDKVKYKIWLTSFKNAA